MPGIETVLQEARIGLLRVDPSGLRQRMSLGAWVIDLRPIDRRTAAGHLPGAVVVDRLVMEWRLDPRSPDRMDPGPGYHDEVYLVCNQGYSSSLAARDLQALGFTRVGDLIGGFEAWTEAGFATTTEPTRYVR